jgi:FKBP-type peptidyl-prolyl cis-trans isomerase
MGRSKKGYISLIGRFVAVFSSVCVLYGPSVAAESQEATTSPAPTTNQGEPGAARPDPILEMKTKFTLKRDIEKVELSERVVKKGSKVSFHIFMQLENGKKVVDSAVDGRPWTGTVGDGSILTGINDGLYGMAEGSKRSLWIPPHLAFGANGLKPDIPPEAKLYAEITLISVESIDP